jgi:cytoskeletal protein RodZ
MSKYPRDEFDRIPESAARQGVHRERLAPPASGGLALKILVVVLALVLALGAYLVLPRLGLGADGEPAGTASSAAAADPSQTQSAESGGTESPEPEPASAAATAAESPKKKSKPAKPAVAIDKSQPVNVYNGTGVSGLASGASARIAADGWTVGQVGNWEPVQASVILYDGRAQRVNAREIGRILGIAVLQQTQEPLANVTVVLGPDFR